jgi:peptide/nickel transport system permease protein
MSVTGPLYVRRRRADGVGLLLAGGILLGLIALAALFAPLIAGVGPTDIDPIGFLTPPSAGHWFGTDTNGMDIWARVFYAARVDLGIALAAVALAILVGGAVGMGLGYAGGATDEVGMRFLDVLQSFPVFILAVMVAALAGNTVPNLILAIGLVNAPSYARLMRSEVRSLKERAYIEAARCAGNSHLGIMARHLLPNALTPILVVAPLNCGWAILMLAGLSFVGLGIPIPGAEWGAMISAGAADVVGGRGWTSVFPGLALFLTVLAFNLLGDGLRDVLDPRGRRKG